MRYRKEERMNNSSLERSRKLRTAGIYAFFIIGCISMIFPFVWMFLTSFKTVEQRLLMRLRLHQKCLKMTPKRLHHLLKD